MTDLNGGEDVLRRERQGGKETRGEGKRRLKRRLVSEGTTQATSAGGGPAALHQLTHNALVMSHLLHTFPKCGKSKWRG